MSRLDIALQEFDQLFPTGQIVNGESAALAEIDSLMEGILSIRDSSNGELHCAHLAACRSADK